MYDILKQYGWDKNINKRGNIGEGNILCLSTELKKLLKVIVLGIAYKYWLRHSLEFIGCGVEQGIDYNLSG